MKKDIVDLSILFTKASEIIKKEEEANLKIEKAKSFRSLLQSPFIERARKP